MWGHEHLHPTLRRPSSRLSIPYLEKLGRPQDPREHDEPARAEGKGKSAPPLPVLLIPLDVPGPGTRAEVLPLRQARMRGPHLRVRATSRMRLPVGFRHDESSVERLYRRRSRPPTHPTAGVPVLSWRGERQAARGVGFKETRVSPFWGAGDQQRPLRAWPSRCGALCACAVRVSKSGRAGRGLLLPGLGLARPSWGGAG